MENNNSRNYSNISGSIIGDNNTVNINNGKNMDELWETSKNEVFQAFRNPAIDTHELHMLQEMYEIILRKDQHGLKAFYKRNKEAFKVNILSGVLGNAICEIIKMVAA